MPGFSGTTDNPKALLPSDVVNNLTNTIVKTSGPSSIVSINDGEVGNALDVNIAIDPVQDLHGYDHPWPAGGGKNKLPLSITSGTYLGISVTIGNDGSVKFSGTRSSAGQIQLYLGDLPKEIQAGESYIFSWVNSIYSMQLMTYDASNNRTVLVNEGNLTTKQITIPSNAVKLEVRISLESTSAYNVTLYPMLRLSSVADASFEPYSNICPISGWTGARVTRTSRNLWDEDWELGGIIWTTGQPTTATDRIRSKNFCAIRPNTEYYAKGDFFLFFYDGSQAFIGYTGYANAAFTTPVNAAYFKVIVLETTTYENNVSVNYPYSDHDYHSSAGISTYDITFPAEAGTVYGGTLDVTNGVLTVDRASVDLGTLIWTYNSESGHLYFTASAGANPSFANSVKKPNTNDDIANIISDLYIKSSYNSVYANISNGIMAIGYSGWLGIVNYSYTDATIFKNAMTGHNLVYELATPVTYQLTPTQIELLEGVNNVWGNTGDTKLTYSVSAGTTKPLSSAQGKELNDNIAKYTSNANGEAWQFDSGLMICTKTVNVAVTWQEWGSIYESTSINYGSFPIAFISIPNVSITLNNSDTAALVTGTGGITTSSAGTGRVVRPNNPGQIAVKLGVIAVGRWK